VAAAALIARASQKRLEKKTAVLIGFAAFALAVVVVILLARTAMPL
jgi:predicted nucleic acid-binding Zn ribbon protein